MNIPASQFTLEFLKSFVLSSEINAKMISVYPNKMVEEPLVEDKTEDVPVVLKYLDTPQSKLLNVTSLSKDDVPNVEESEEEIFVSKDGAMETAFVRYPRLRILVEHIKMVSCKKCDFISEGEKSIQAHLADVHQMVEFKGNDKSVQTKNRKPSKPRQHLHRACKDRKITKRMKKIKRKMRLREIMREVEMEHNNKHKPVQQNTQKHHKKITNTKKVAKCINFQNSNMVTQEESVCPDCGVVFKTEQLLYEHRTASFYQNALIM